MNFLREEDASLDDFALRFSKWPLRLSFCKLFDLTHGGFNTNTWYDKPSISLDVLCSTTSFSSKLHLNPTLLTLFQFFIKPQQYLLTNAFKAIIPLAFGYDCYKSSIPSISLEMQISTIIFMKNINVRNKILRNLQYNNYLVCNFLCVLKGLWYALLQSFPTSRHKYNQKQLPI